MATKKGYCPYCRKLSLKDRTFTVNPNAAVTYCPHCLREIEPKKAIQLFAKAVDSKINEAYVLLLCDTRFHEAYQAFADVIAIDENNLRARLGRVLALIYISTLRDNKIDDALVLLQGEVPLYCRGTTSFVPFVSFVKNIDTALDEYNENFRKLILFRGYFYDYDCMKLFHTRLAEIHAFKTYLYETLQNYEEKNGLEAEELSTKLMNDILFEEKEMNVLNITCIGNKYRLTGFGNDGYTPVFAMDEDHLGTRFTKREIASLDNNVRRRNGIPDDVFRSYVNRNRSLRTAVPFTVLLGLLTAADVICYVILHQEQFSLLFLGGGILFLVAFALSLVMEIIGFHAIRKRRKSLKF